MSRVGEVWRAIWSSYPEQLLLVVRHDAFWNKLLCLDLLSGEQLELMPSDLKAKKRVKATFKRFV